MNNAEQVKRIEALLQRCISAARTRWGTEGFHRMPLDELRAAVDQLALSIPLSKLCELLPGVYYMDPPDGGDVSVYEQLRRMSEDAARWRYVREGANPYYRLLYDSWGEQTDLVGDRADEVIDKARAIDTDVN